MTWLVNPVFGEASLAFDICADADRDSVFHIDNDNRHRLEELADNIIPQATSVIMNNEELRDIISCMKE